MIDSITLCKNNDDYDDDDDDAQKRSIMPIMDWLRNYTNNQHALLNR